MGNQIEGELPAGSRVLVVEDLISTGGSSLKAVDAAYGVSLYSDYMSFDLVHNS